MKGGWVFFMAADLSNSTDLLTWDKDKPWWMYLTPDILFCPAMQQKEVHGYRIYFVWLAFASSSIFNETSICISQCNALPLFAEYFVL